MKGLKPHRFAELLPLMSDAEYQAFKADVVATKRFTDPIKLFEGRILDGRNRYRVHQETGIPLKKEDFDGGTAEAVAYVKSKMMIRNLDSARKACVAIGFADVFEAQAKERMLKGAANPDKKIYQGGGRDPRAMDLLASLFGVNPTYLYNAKKLRDASPKLFQQVFEGSKPLPVAVREMQRKAKSREWRNAAATSTLGKDELQILIGDNRKVQERMPAESIDLCATDPPYGIGEKYNGFNDRLSREQLMHIIAGSVNQTVRVLKPHGSMFMMMSSRYAEDVGLILRRAGLHRQSMIIWAESFGTYNPKFWSDCYRVIHHYTKHPTKFTFNHDDKRLFIPSWRTENGDNRADKDGKMPGNVWGVWTDRGVARLVDNSPERIPDKRAVNQLPVAIMQRIILMASNPGDLVMDTFHGTGTTSRAALANGRKYIGIEIDGAVADASRDWIKTYLAKRKAA